ncbi:EscU/YscU/HrcU family type III secretion system export apparatus switch protein [Aminobacterium sp. MB27-C1]|uniref:EscU/YscU/HrcU family type III secretion system export apparatus switch protein n=1 Tax=Aminobacterium sp. MB27-C1 TaxID=3070661 RepID=UPI0027DE5B86|nr:EscU/YscU/HrcU family type III secretion system export apparatus switch protein [Aminobacterium sp. MB27-C1]WMI71892.1 EscU/YscU/HrcU family type III secretion system export apparatus switch protein [Aminobacterium sp. MB27-C1]
MNAFDKRKKAAALSYNPEKDNAPRVGAFGEDFLARRIIEVAKEANIPIVEDAALVSALLTLELGEEIPVDLYEAVARILAFLYKLDKGDE